mgnify:CR=1 FL=1
MKSPLIVPHYRHNTSDTIKFLLLGYSYTYLTKRDDHKGGKGYYTYPCGANEGEFYPTLREAYNRLIEHTEYRDINGTNSKISKIKCYL